MSRTYKDVAIVREVRRYSVKSMSGEQVVETKIGWHGLAGDRRFGFVRKGNPSGLPFLSSREVPRLTLYRAEYIDPANPDRSNAQVVTPGGQSVAVDSEELLKELEEHSGQPLYLQRLWRGCFDSMDISMITLDSIRTISNAIGRDLEALRFRPNIVLEALESKPFPEEAWVGETLRIGDRDDSAWMRADRRDQRCVVVNLDPQTGCSSPEVMAEIIAKRKNNLGIYGTAVRPGTIRVGDIVSVAK